MRGRLVCTHKAVSSGLPRLSVRYHHSLVNVPKDLEVFSQRGVVRVVWQPADEDFGKSSVFLKRCGMHDFQSSVHELMQKHWSAGERTGGTLKTFKALSNVPASVKHNFTPESLWFSSRVGLHSVTANWWQLWFTLRGSSASTLVASSGAVRKCAGRVYTHGWGHARA